MKRGLRFYLGGGIPWIWIFALSRFKYHKTSTIFYSYISLFSTSSHVQVYIPENPDLNYTHRDISLTTDRYHNGNHNHDHHNDITACPFLCPSLRNIRKPRLGRPRHPRPLQIRPTRRKTRTSHPIPKGDGRYRYHHHNIMGRAI